MTTIEPAQNENPLDFVERADAMELSDELINVALKEHFGFVDDGEMKKLKLQSKVFWERFYLDHATEILKRGGARYSALKFIQKKNASAEQRRKLSDEKINELIDSVGAWQR